MYNERLVEAIVIVAPDTGFDTVIEPICGGSGYIVAGIIHPSSNLPRTSVLMPVTGTKLVTLHLDRLDQRRALPVRLLGQHSQHNIPLRRGQGHRHPVVGVHATRTFNVLPVQ